MRLLPIIPMTSVAAYFLHEHMTDMQAAIVWGMFAGIGFCAAWHIQSMKL